jgi:hypothetical protein
MRRPNPLSPQPLTLPPATKGQTLAGYLRSNLPTLERCAEAGIRQAEIRAALAQLGFSRISAPTFWKELWRARHWVKTRRPSVDKEKQTDAPHPVPLVPPAVPPSPTRRRARRAQLEIKGGFQEETATAASDAVSSENPGATDDLSHEGMFTDQARARRKADIDRFFSDEAPILNHITRNRK